MKAIIAWKYEHDFKDPWALDKVSRTLPENFCRIHETS